MEQRLQLLKEPIKEKSSAPSNKISKLSTSLLRITIFYVTHVNLKTSYPPDIVNLLAGIKYIDIKTAKFSLFISGITGVSSQSCTDSDERAVTN